MIRNTRPLKAILFGGSGYIGINYLHHVIFTLKGSALVPKLQEIFPDCHLAIASRSGKSNGISQDVSFIKCDITNEQDVKRAAKDCDLLINLVGIMDEIRPKYTFDAIQHQVKI